MGNALTNERAKLAAAYFNNIAVGMMVAGVVIPYINLFHLMGEVGPLSQVLATQSSGKLFANVGGGIAAVLISILAHFVGQWQLAGIKD